MPPISPVKATLDLPSTPLLPPRRRLKGNTILGVVIAAGLLVAVLVGPLLAPYNPIAISLREKLHTPSWQHLLGTDELGRDILSRLLTGTRLTMGLALGAVLIAMAIGVPLGLLAGYFSGPFDYLISRCVDIMMTLPGFLLALLLVAILGPGMLNVSLAVGAYMVPHFVRVTRGDTMAIRQLDYITAARTVGAGDCRIILWYILPNVVASILVLATLRIATAVLIISGLSFLGLGARPPTPEWGAMIATARNFLLTSPHAIVFPGIALVLAVYSLNTLGDHLRDVLDPHLRGS